MHREGEREREQSVKSEPFARTSKTWTFGKVRVKKLAESKRITEISKCELCACDIERSMAIDTDKKWSN